MDDYVPDSKAGCMAMVVSFGIVAALVVGLVVAVVLQGVRP